MKRFIRLGMLLALGLLLSTGPANAAFHLMMVVGVFPGFPLVPNAQFVQLQMYMPGQNFVQGHAVHIYNAAGTEIGVFPFLGSVPNGANQAKILIATAEAQTVFGLTADLTMTPLIAASGGKACFDGPTPFDCVAWGNYSGSSTGVGNPFSPAGLTLGMVAARRLDRGTPLVLDLPDDTNDSATDFVYEVPAPTTNPGVVGATAGYGSTPAPPGPIDFGSSVVSIPTAGASFQVMETGNNALTVGNPVLGGAYPGDFSVVTGFPITIANGGPPRTVQLGCTPMAAGARSATLTLNTIDPLRPTVVYDLTCAGVPPPDLNFFTVTPCREVDTRLGGGPLAAGADRTFTIGGGTCGIPVTAKAVSLNIAVTEATASGNVRLFPTGSTPPAASTINYSTGQTRTNNIVAGLGVVGGVTARCAPSGATHLVLDVNGYFE